MKLDIDLNKLSMEQLKMVIQLADSSQEEPQEEKKKQPIVVFTKRTRRGKWTPEMVAELEEIVHKYGKYTAKSGKAKKRFAKKYKLGLKAVQIRAYPMYMVMDKYKDAKQEPDSTPTHESHTMIRDRPVLPQSPQEQALRESVVKQELPQIKMVFEDAMPILEGMLKNIIKYRGSMTYQMEGLPLGIESEEAWHTFCVDLLAKSNHISNYFSVANHFKYVDTIAGGKITYGA